jgi:hypothetical protein
MEYRKEQSGSLITLWNDKKGVGLQFKEGEPLQRYTSSVVLADKTLTSTEAGLAIMNKAAGELMEHAARLYPKESGEMK